MSGTQEDWNAGREIRSSRVAQRWDWLLGDKGNEMSAWDWLELGNEKI